MKNSIIREIFYDNLEKIALPKSYNDNLVVVANELEKLKTHFNAEQIAYIDKFLTLYDDNHLEETTLYFIEGFKLAMRVAKECFEEK